METFNQYAPFFGSLSCLVGVAIVTAVSILLSRHYRQEVFVHWVLAYGVFVLSMATSTLYHSGQKAPLVIIVFALTYLTGTALAVRATYKTWGTTMPGWQWAAILGMMVHAGGAALAEAPLMHTIGPSVVLCSIIFVILGRSLLRTPVMPRGSGIRWLAIPMILKGLWIGAYIALSQTSFEGLGYFIDAGLQILLGLGIVVYLLEGQSHQLSLLMDGILGHALFWVDQQGVIASWNSGAQRLYGYRKEDVEGHKLSFLAPLSLLKLPEDLPKTRDGRHTTLDMTGWHTRADGSQMWARATLSPIHLKSNKLVGYSVLVKDLTEKRAAQEERARLSAVIEQATESVLLFDVARQPMYVNPAFERKVGYSIRDISDQGLSQLVRGHEWQKTLESMWRTATRGMTWKGDLAVVGRDGQEIAFEATLSPIYGECGRIINHAAILRDVSRERELEARLRQSEKLQALGTMAGGIAHDFNNILQAIIAHTEFAKNALPYDVREPRKDLEDVLKASKRARDIVNQILVFSRKSDPDLEPMRPADVVKEATRLIAPTLPSGVLLETRVVSDCPLIEGDATQLHQVVMNLCRNAVLAIGTEAGRIEVTLEEIGRAHGDQLDSLQLPAGRYVLLTVSDTGCGMPKEVKDRIFNPFFTTRASGKGTGLGLSVVHGIVSTHKGAITVDSRLGEGSRFRIYLPVTDDEEPCQQAAEPVAMQGNERILFVDDDEMVLASTARMLDLLGYRAQCFSNARDALETFSRSPCQFDLVITDFSMPDMSGAEVARATHDLRTDIPVIVMSGHGARSSKTRVDSAGVVEYVGKPVNPATLNKVMRRLLDDSLARSHRRTHGSSSCEEISPRSVSMPSREAASPL